MMGRDHTISALVKGYVRYYKDPEKNPDRKYIGVVFEQHESLPRGRNSSRRRRLGMDASLMEEPVVSDGTRLLEGVLAEEVDKTLVQSVADGAAPGSKPQLTLRSAYQYRESNTSIGRTAERANVKVRAWSAKDRWQAWRKRNIRKAKAAERRALRRKK